MDRGTGAHQIAVPVGVVDAAYRRPHFVFQGVRHRIARLLAAVGQRPLLGHEHGLGVGRVLERIVVGIRPTVGDLHGLGVDREHRVAESVEFDLRLRLGGFDHHRSAHGEAHGGCVVPKVH